MLAVLACAGLGALLYTLDWSPAIARWNQYLSSTGDSRLEVAGICLRLSADAGWFGFGPGAFDAVFQHYVSQHDLAQHGPGIGVRWVNAHNDYLQTLIDWGYMGTALWATFCFTPLRGAMGHVAAEIFPRARRRTFGQGKPSRLQRRDPLKVAVSLSILGVFVHAAYDFPLQIPGIEIYTAVLASLLSSSPHLK
jgi:O-antigen ligase